jgi:hypothetical protein
MDICNQIRRERRLGTSRCDVLDGSMSIVEAARMFGLAGDPAIYREIERAEADAIAAHILQADLAYGSCVMSGSRAANLWRRFVALFEGQDVRFATNAGSFPGSWNPATSATFDLGVLVIGTSKAGCLWVEDED